MRKDSKYGEPTKMVCFRVPESKVSEIKKLVKFRLNEFERLALDVDIDAYEKSRVGCNEFEEKFVVPAEELANNINLKKITEKDFERVSSLPLGTELVKGYGAKGALRTLDDKEYYTKRTHEGKLEILKYKNFASALLYCEENFK